MIISKLQQFIIFNCDQQEIDINELLGENINRIHSIQKVGYKNRLNQSNVEFNKLSPNTIYLVITKVGNLRYEIPGAREPTSYCSPKIITKLTAINSNIELGYPCIPQVQCPEDSEKFGLLDCCGESNKLEYYASSGLVYYQTISRYSVLSFIASDGDITSMPLIIKLKYGENYYGLITMNTNRYIGKYFQIIEGCTKYTGVFAIGDVLMAAENIC